MKTFLAIVIVILLGVIGWMWYSQQSAQAPSADNGQQTTQPQTLANDQTYTNQKLHFSVMHPSVTADSAVDYSGYLPLTQTPLTSFVLPSSLYAGTNLGEAGVYIGATTTPKALTACSEGTAAAGETALGKETVNGADFFFFSANDAGAGNFYESKIYRRIENGWCVEAVELLHSGNIANYPQGAVKEFDKAYFRSILESIVHTYQSIPTGA